jgi:hypothetical protein
MKETPAKARCDYEVEYDDAHPWPGGGWLCGKPATTIIRDQNGVWHTRCGDHART